ncbi:MAG: hypothetical protein ABQ298_01845 [Puniceicoccaceae bacterium]
MSNNRNHALATILRAVEAKRLPHALLLKGRNLAALKHAALEVAGALLHSSSEQVSAHPDFFLLQARNRMRQISVDHTRELMRNIQHSPSAGERKVALVMEVDRMNHESANAFLKTLEEPPLNTSILLTTVKPNALLDTIVSRCLSFWFHEPEEPLADPAWIQWKAEFCTWLQRLPIVPKERQEISERLMRLYGLLEGFHEALEGLKEHRWQQEKLLLPEHTPEEELLAMEVGVARSVRVQLLAEMETTIRDFAVGLIETEAVLSTDDISARLDSSVRELEYLRGLLEVNLAESKMLEAFLLKMLRIWSARAS